MTDTTAPATTVRALRAGYWQRTRRLTGALLLAWFSSTFCAIFFARELATLTLFGWPLSFYLAAQGISLLYLLILAIYAWRMRRYDAQLHAATQALERPQ
jgi:putative solute:sodium symporter small subunit